MSKGVSKIVTDIPLDWKEESRSYAKTYLQVGLGLGNIFKLLKHTLVIRSSL